MAELGVARARPEPPPAEHHLVGLDDESTAAVRRRKPEARVRVRVDHRGRLERLLLPMTVVLLLLAALALTGAIVLRSAEHPAPAAKPAAP
jgi:hypothetical protein